METKTERDQCLELLICGYIRRNENDLKLFMNLPAEITQILHKSYPVLEAFYRNEEKSVSRLTFKLKGRPATHYGILSVNTKSALNHTATVEISCSWTLDVRYYKSVAIGICNQNKPERYMCIFYQPGKREEIRKPDEWFDEYSMIDETKWKTRYKYKEASCQYKIEKPLTLVMSLESKLPYDTCRLRYSYGDGKEICAFNIKNNKDEWGLTVALRGVFDWIDLKEFKNDSTQSIKQ